MEATHNDFLCILLLVLAASCHGVDMVGDRELTYFPLPQNYFSAFEICRAEGKQLLTIHNEQENKQFLAIADKYKPFQSTGFWLGATDLGLEGSWVWTMSGQKVTYAQFVDGQPDNFKGREHCLEITHSSDFSAMTGHDSQCLTMNQFFCEEAGNEKGPKYIVYRVWMNWFTAAEVCRRHGRQLVEINSEEKNLEVTSFGREHGLGWLWTAATDLGASRRWAWSTSGELVQNMFWRSGEPNNMFNNCVEMIVDEYSLN